MRDEKRRGSSRWRKRRKTAAMSLVSGSLLCFCLNTDGRWWGGDNGWVWIRLGRMVRERAIGGGGGREKRKVVGMVPWSPIM
jgi:hypothetical protein